MLGVKTPMYIGVKKFLHYPCLRPFPGEKLNKSENRWINIVPGKHLQSFVVVLEYVRAVLAKSETLSERSEFADDFDVLNSQVIF